MALSTGLPSHLDHPLDRNSKAPMSHSGTWSSSPSTGRRNPRWSVRGGGQRRATQSTAGLPATRAWVFVGPPFDTKVVSRMAASAVGVDPSEVAVISLGLGQEAHPPWPHSQPRAVPWSPTPGVGATAGNAMRVCPRFPSQELRCLPVLPLPSFPVRGLYSCCCQSTAAIFVIQQG